MLPRHSPIDPRVSRSIIPGLGYTDYESVDLSSGDWEPTKGYAGHISVRNHSGSPISVTVQAVLLYNDDSKGEWIQYRDTVDGFAAWTLGTLTNRPVMPALIRKIIASRDYSGTTYSTTINPMITYAMFFF